MLCLGYVHLCKYFCGAAKSNRTVRMKGGGACGGANQSQQQLNTVNHGSDLNSSALFVNEYVYKFVCKSVEENVEES